ncbi:MAG: alpha/beta hydrolase, partial [Flavobacteriales bacterium]
MKKRFFQSIESSKKPIEIYRLFFLHALFLILFTSQLKAQQTASGTLYHVASFGSDSLFRRDLDIWVPDGFPANMPYSVLYMHDGQMLFDSTSTWNHKEWMLDETLGRLINEGSIKPIIVVGIHNGGISRHSDYFPLKPLSKLTPERKDSIIHLMRPDTVPLFHEFSIRSDRYLKFLIEEVKPYVDSNYSTSTDMKDTYIGGSSMGGLI